MPSRNRAPRGHTGTTDGGHVRFVRAERIGRITIYKRGNTYSLYYRENGRTIRSPIDGRRRSPSSRGTSESCFQTEPSQMATRVV